jgi:hypothetical protein
VVIDRKVSQNGFIYDRNRFSKEISWDEAIEKTEKDWQIRKEQLTTLK